MSTVAEDTTFRVILRVDVKPGMEADFERVWLSGSPDVTADPANRGHDLHDGGQGTYVIISDWVSEAAFRAWESSQSHLDHRAKLHPYRSGGSMTTLNVRARPTAARAAA